MPELVVISFFAVQLTNWLFCMRMLSLIVNVLPRILLISQEKALAGGLLEASHFRVPVFPLITSIVGPSTGTPSNAILMSSGASDVKNKLSVRLCG